MRSVAKSVVVSGLALSLAAPAMAADVVVGVPNWPSAVATANVIKVVLEDNLGLEVELQNGTNAVFFEGMDAGSVHVHPEVWLPNQNNLNQKFVKEKGTVVIAPKGVAGDQAVCVTKGTAERTGITELSELSDPDMAKHFDTDGDGKGEMWIGAAGWASTVIEKIRAKSYGYDETMSLKEMDESLALYESALPWWKRGVPKWVKDATKTKSEQHEIVIGYVDVRKTSPASLVLVVVDDKSKASALTSQLSKITGMRTGERMVPGSDLSQH